MAKGSPDPPAGLATLAVAADRLMMSRRNLYRLRDRSELEFVYVGDASPRVRESDLDRLVACGVRGRRRMAGAVAL